MAEPEVISVHVESTEFEGTSPYQEVSIRVPSGYTWAGHPALRLFAFVGEGPIYVTHDDETFVVEGGEAFSMAPNFSVTTTLAPGAKDKSIPFVVTYCGVEYPEEYTYKASQGVRIRRRIDVSQASRGNLRFAPLGAENIARVLALETLPGESGIAESIALASVDARLITTVISGMPENDVVGFAVLENAWTDSIGVAHVHALHVHCAECVPTYGPYIVERLLTLLADANGFAHNMPIHFHARTQNPMVQVFRRFGFEIEPDADRPDAIVAKYVYAKSVAAQAASALPVGELPFANMQKSKIHYDLTRTHTLRGHPITEKQRRAMWARLSGTKYEHSHGHHHKK
jgi:hypothetical protein